jgi:hypothetical protein
MDQPRAPALSGRVKATILVRFDHGPHRRPTMASCKVLERHGYDAAAGTWFATVEHEGRPIRVQHTMVKGVWAPTGLNG